MEMVALQSRVPTFRARARNAAFMEDIKQADSHCGGFTGSVVTRLKANVSTILAERQDVVFTLIHQHLERILETGTLARSEGVIWIVHSDCVTDKAKSVEDIRSL